MRIGTCSPASRRPGLRRFPRRASAFDVGVPHRQHVRDHLVHAFLSEDRSPRRHALFRDTIGHDRVNVGRRSAVDPVLVGQVRAETDPALPLRIVASEALGHEDLLARGHRALVGRERVERLVGDDAPLRLRRRDRLGVLLRSAAADGVLVIVEPVDQTEDDRSVEGE